MNNFEKLIVDNILKKFENKEYERTKVAYPNVYTFFFTNNFLGNEINSLLRNYPDSIEKLNYNFVEVYSKFGGKNLIKKYVNSKYIIPNFNLNIGEKNFYNYLKIYSEDDFLRIEITEGFFNYFKSLVSLEEKRELDKIINKKQKTKTKKRL